jgi:hypothetical protein
MPLFWPCSVSDAKAVSKSRSLDAMQGFMDKEIYILTLLAYLCML